MAYSPDPGYRAPKRAYNRARDNAKSGTIDKGGEYRRYEYKTERGAMNRAKRDYDERIANIEMAENAGEILDGTIVVTRTTNYEGVQCKATLQYRYIDTDGDTNTAFFEGKRTSGGGYDKVSTAVANVLNRSPEFTRLAYKMYEDDRIERGEGVAFYGDATEPFYARGVGMEAIIYSLRQMGLDVYTSMDNSKQTVYTITRNTPLPSESIKDTAKAVYGKTKTAAQKGVRKTRAAAGKAKARVTPKKKAPVKSESKKGKAPTKKQTTKTSGTRRR